MMKAIRVIVSMMKMTLLAGCICFLFHSKTYARQRDSYQVQTAAIKERIKAAEGFSTEYPDSALHIFLDILAQSKKLNYSDGFVSAHLNLGNAYAAKGDYTKAFTSINTAIEYCKLSGRETQHLATLYNNKASIYLFQGKYPEAMDNFSLAIDATEKYTSNFPVDQLYCNIGLVLYYLKEFDKALYYLDKAETSVRKKSNSSDLLAAVLLNKGIVYGMTEQYDKGRKYFKEVEEIALKNNNYSALTTCYVNLGNIDLAQKNNRQAIAYYEKAARIKNQMNPYYYNLAILSLGRVYYEVKEYAAAKRYLEQSLKTAAQTGITRDEVQSHNGLALVHAALGNYKEAYEHSKEELTLKDSLQSKEKLEAINQTEAKFRTALKDKEIFRHQLLIKSQSEKISRKNLLILVIASVGSVLVLIFVVVYYKFRHKQRLQKKQMQILLQQQEIARLRAIMNGEEKERTRIARELHDGIMVRFSAVQMNLSALTVRPEVSSQSLNDIAGQLHAATSDLRKTAHHLMPDMLLEEGLKDALSYFIKSIQGVSGLEIHFICYDALPELDAEMALSIYRVVQELLQNVLKHARATSCIVQLDYNEGVLLITVEDNGKGIDRNKIVENKGLGFKSIRARVNAYNGTMEIDSSEGEGTSIYLEFKV